MNDKKDVKTASQEVPLIKGEEKMVIQEVTYYPDDKWIVLEHAKHEMPMNLDNLKSLIALATKVIEEAEKEQPEG